MWHPYSISGAWSICLAFTHLFCVVNNGNTWQVIVRRTDRESFAGCLELESSATINCISASSRSPSRRRPAKYYPGAEIRALPDTLIVTGLLLSTKKSSVVYWTTSAVLWHHQRHYIDLMPAAVCPVAHELNPVPFRVALAMHLCGDNPPLPHSKLHSISILYSAVWVCAHGGN